MVVIKPPVEIPYSMSFDAPSVFLAGSIEMGKAAFWQDEVIEFYENDPVAFFNPRRDDWDSTWEQSKDNEQFREQVEWELNALERSDFIFLYLQAGTKSPISLLELGLFAYRGKRVVVCCPDGFWRKGNVDIVCERAGIPVFEDFNRAKMSLLGMIHSWRKPIQPPEP